MAAPLPLTHVIHVDKDVVRVSTLGPDALRVRLVVGGSETMDGLTFRLKRTRWRKELQVEVSGGDRPFVVPITNHDQYRLSANGTVQPVVFSKPQPNPVD